MTHLTPKQQHWQSIIEDWRQSGLSQAGYCRQHQLTPQHFYFWKNRLKKKLHKSEPTPKGVFLPVVWGQSTPEAESSLRVRCHGADIDVTHQTDPELFKKAIQWLGELP